jgi:glutathione S-transferase fosA5
MITGINHITLSVRSLSESFEFYKNILGFKPLMKKKKSAYLLVGDCWLCIEEDPMVRAQELPEYTHIAFAVDQSNFNLVSEKIKISGAKIFKENKSEGESIYFIDPNGHKLEVHVGDWKSRLAVYRSQTDGDTEFFD